MNSKNINKISSFAKKISKKIKDNAERYSNTGYKSIYNPMEVLQPLSNILAKNICEKIFKEIQGDEISFIEPGAGFLLDEFISHNKYKINYILDSSKKNAKSIKKRYPYVKIYNEDICNINSLIESKNIISYIPTYKYTDKKNYEIFSKILLHLKKGGKLFHVSYTPPNYQPIENINGTQIEIFILKFPITLWMYQK